MTTLILNNELNGIEIKFTEKPSSETLEALKTNGFHWHRVKKLWYAKNTPERLQIAQTVANGGAVEVTTKTESKKNTCSLSLWERCKIDDIPVHSKNLDTKTIAAETRKHIKERFPEIKFSCRIGSGRWAASNEVKIYDGFIPNVPLELTRDQINENMYHLRSAGSGVHEFMIDVFKYYKNNNILPVVNTLQF